jgi:HK97 family phage prohead protease
MSDTATANGQGIIRAYRPGVELRAATDDGMPTLHGHFAVFNKWTEIDSFWEGRFMERIVPGAFKKTFQENRNQVKALFQHGQDPQIGDKPLGPVKLLEEDATGAAYEVPLLDTAYNRELIPGLEAGLYGASFRFKVTREETVDDPEASDTNPQALPERSIKELRLFELGPVTFPAYADATAGVRSLTDRFLFDALERDPARVQELLAAMRMDVEDLDTLAQMIQLGAVYIEDQDEPEDQKNIPVMEGVLATLAGLVPVEVQENEPVEPEDEAMGRSTDDAANQSTSDRKSDAATTRTSDDQETVKQWPTVPREEFEELWIHRI